MGWGRGLDSRQDRIKQLGVRRGGGGAGVTVLLLQVGVMAAWAGWWPSNWRGEGAF